MIGDICSTEPLNSYWCALPHCALFSASHIKDITCTLSQSETLYHAVVQHIAHRVVRQDKVCTCASLGREGQSGYNAGVARSTTPQPASSTTSNAAQKLPSNAALASASETMRNRSQRHRQPPITRPTAGLTAGSHQAAIVATLEVVIGNLTDIEGESQSRLDRRPQGTLGDQDCATPVAGTGASQ